MEYIKLASTDLRVSKLGLGTVQLGMPYGLGLPTPPSDASCIALLHQARDLGITYFDTAAAYGRSEELIGRAFSPTESSLVLATKVTLSTGGDAEPLRGQALCRHLETSLQRSITLLGREPLDLVQFHNTAEDFPTDELSEYTDRFTQRGLVRYWGATTYGQSAPAQALQWPGLRTLQVAYSALDRRLEASIFPQCRQKGTGLILRSVFLKGILTRQNENLPSHLASLGRAAKTLENLAAQGELTLPQLALRFAAFRPEAHITLFGTTNPLELQDNIATVEAGPLDDDLLNGINAIEVEDRDLLNPGTWGF